MMFDFPSLKKKMLTNKIQKGVVVTPMEETLVPKT
jgi:hypothetical protein